MSATKQALIERAYTELGLPPWTYTLAPEQAIYACERMDAMVAEWGGIRGVRIAYNFGDNPAADSGVAKSHEQAVSLQLAIALAPSMGKVLSEQTLALAEASWGQMLIAAAQPVQTQMPPNMPRGAGAKTHRGSPYQTFMPAPDLAPLTVTGDGTELEL